MADKVISWWRHQMETFSASMAICAGNSPVTGEFPTKRPVTRGFDVFFDLRVNKRLSKQSTRQFIQSFALFWAILLHRRWSTMQTYFWNKWYSCIKTLRLKNMAAILRMIFRKNFSLNENMAISGEKLICVPSTMSQQLLKKLSVNAHWAISHYLINDGLFHGRM